jgi:hypothetical protein|tara:strand:- start:200 stop:388 length:189 start_codon:yes stop_codon:yes gene_type:complete
LAIRTNPGSIFAGNLRQTADRIVKAIAPWRIDKQATRQQLDKQATRQQRNDSTTDPVKYGRR